MSIADQVKEKMMNTVEHLKNELKNLRTGRAHPGLVEGVMIEIYGSQMRLKEVANINAPEARVLVVSPFDKTTINQIAKGIEKANLGFMPNIDGTIIRLNIPPLDEASRKEMAKVAKKRTEEAKVAIRQIRRDFNDKIKQEKNAGTLPEDLMKKHEKKIQELTDQFCDEAEKLCEAKEKEILAV